MRHVDTDPESGTEIRQLTAGERAADNIYGEQPYASPDGARIAVRRYGDVPDRVIALGVFDLRDGTTPLLLDEARRFPAFAAWSRHFWYQVEEGDRLTLRRLDWATLRRETVLALPSSEGSFSYGTVSPDDRYYAVSVHGENRRWRVLCFDLATGRQRTLAESDYWLFKHEQFSRDGRNRVLIQANSPDVSEVHLGTMEVDGTDVRRLAADRPHTPRPTGHECWIGTADRVFYSTARDEERGTNLFAVGVDAPSSTLVPGNGRRYGHVSVSACGRYWIADAIDEPGIPIYAGSFASGRVRRLVVSGTVHDRYQWSHTHPYLTADSAWLVFTSNRDGAPQVYAARVPEGFLAGL